MRQQHHEQQCTASPAVQAAEVHAGSPPCPAPPRCAPPAPVRTQVPASPRMPSCSRTSASWWMGATTSPATPTSARATALSPASPRACCTARSACSCSTRRAGCCCSSARPTRSRSPPCGPTRAAATRCTGSSRTRWTCRTRCAVACVLVHACALPLCCRHVQQQQQQRAGMCARWHGPPRPSARQRSSVRGRRAAR